MTTDRVVEILEDKNACSECACNMSDSITCDDCEKAIKIAIEAVKDMEKYKKSIEKSERPKGKWLTPYGSYSYRLTTYRCSLCECETDNRSNYCPHCGAYMKGEW